MALFILVRAFWEFNLYFGNGGSRKFFLSVMPLFFKRILIISFEGGDNTCHFMLES
jgi:hypothetical protein